MSTASSRRWVVPLFCLIFGFVYLAVFWIGGNFVAGVGPFVIMVGYGLLLLVGGRSEVVRTLRNQPSDEMWSSFAVRASLFSFYVLIVVLLGMVLYEIARGQDAYPYALLCLVGGASYIGALVWLRMRG
ncbi:MAG: hypothetical protein ACRDTR_10905 [Rubrobacter sp.]